MTQIKKDFFRLGFLRTTPLARNPQKTYVLRRELLGNGKYIFFFFIIFLFPAFVHSQQDAVWIFGGPGYIINGDTCCAFDMTFIGDTFQVSHRGGLVGGGGAFGGVSSGGGGAGEAMGPAASICTELGELLLYSNAKVICNAAGDTLLGGDSLAMDTDLWFDTLGLFPFCNRTVQFIPKPGTSKQYYLLHPYWTRNPFFNSHGIDVSDYFLKSFLYSEIDMSANGGNGAVIVRNQLLLQDSLRVASTCLTKHANGRDWWLIIPHHNKNIYHTYLIDPNGFTKYPDQVLGSPYPYDWGSSKECYFSEDGSKLVITCPQRYIFMDFDRCTGILSNYTQIGGLFSWYSWEETMPAGHLWFPTVLSPNNRFLYVVNGFGIDLDNPTGDENLSRNKLYQYDLQASDIPNSRIELMSHGVNTGFIGSPHLTPNGLLLLSYGNLGFGATTLNFLKNPNLLGFASKPTSISYDKYGYYHYPLLPNYRLGALIDSPCDTVFSHVGIAPIENKDMLQVYPNPTTGDIRVEITAELAYTHWYIYNSIGILVNEGVFSDATSQNLSFATLAKGLYFLKCGKEYVKIVIE